MALNKVKPGSNMYQFITDTWNPLAGECTHKCSYCSTHKLAKRYPEIEKKYSGPLRLDDNCMKDNFGKDKFIFVVAQNDLFAWEVPGQFILDILEHCRKFNCQYLFQTKNPKRIFDYLGYFSEDSRICTTIETNRWYPQMGNAPKIEDRVDAMKKLVGFKKYVTVEPIFDFDLNEMMRMMYDCSPQQINIGADSGNNNLPEPSKEKLEQLIFALKCYYTIDKKTNLKRLLQ